jgi:hypothetical protein
VSGNDQKPPFERAVELLVYAPLGAALFVRDVLPPLVEQFVARGRTQLEQQVSQARIIGQFAVNQGGQELDRRLQKVRERGEGMVKMVPFDRLAGAPASPAAPPAPEPPAAAPAPATPTPATSAVGGNGATADSSHLPIPDYDELSASQVVARLGGLSGDELASVREYEESGRQRKTILTKIEQLSG